MKSSSGIITFVGRIALAFGIAGVHTATGGPIGLANLHALAGQSDAVVVGTVVQGQQTGRDVSFLLSVDRVLKGEVNPSETLTVQWISPNAFNGSRDLKGSRGLFFLQKPQTGAWQLLPAMAGDTVFDLAVLPATRGPLSPDLQYAPAASIDEKLLLELAAAIENNDGSAFAIDYLAGLDAYGAPALLKAYQRLSQSPSTGLKAYGIAGLIRQGDIQVLSALATNLPAINAGASGNLIVNGLCQYSNANPAAVGALGMLSEATATIPRLQFCTAAALRRIHSRETLVYLQRLLDSQDPQVRYEAVAGLASFANSGSIPRELPLVVDGAVVARPPNTYKNSQTLDNFPTVDTFRQSEAKYIAFWKGWWSSVQPGFH